ncbi:uncharacterized protein ISCGN_017938 [Ixodes scapularis]
MATVAPRTTNKLAHSKKPPITMDPDFYVKNNGYQRKFNLQVLELMRGSFTDETKEQQFLDLGCGTGDFTRDQLLPLWPDAGRIVAVDVSQDMVEHAKRKFAHPKICYDVLDIGGSGVADFVGRYGQFDRVYSFFCLHWIRNQERAFKNIADLMRPAALYVKMLLLLKSPAGTWLTWRFWFLHRRLETLSLAVLLGLLTNQSREPEQRPQLTVPVYTGYNDAKSFADFLGPWGNPGVKTSTGRAAGQEDVPLFRLGRVVRPGKHVDLFFVDWPGGPISLEWLEPPVQRHGDRSGASTQPQQQQKRQMVLTPPPPPPLPPLPPQPVPAEVAAADGGSVETTDEHEDRPVSSKRAALDPERPAPEPSGGRYERLKKRVESIERSLDERFARQTEQINEMFSEVNNSVAQLAEQLTQALATLTARMDDVEVRLPPGAHMGLIRLSNLVTEEEKPLLLKDVAEEGAKLFAEKEAGSSPFRNTQFLMTVLNGAAKSAFIVVHSGISRSPCRPRWLRVDGGSVETTDEPEDRPVSSKRAALDPERPAPEPSGGRYESERILDERFARQTEQINEMFSVLNNSVAQLAEQLTQALATLTARMDDVEVRLPPGTNRPIRATGKPYARPQQQQQQSPLMEAETQQQQPSRLGGGPHLHTRFTMARHKKSTHASECPQQYTIWQWNCPGYRRERGNLQQFVRSREKPHVILLQETNAPVQLAGYKAIDAAGTCEGQGSRRGRAVAAGRRGRRAPLSSPAPPPPPPPAAAVLVRRNVTMAQRELQGVKVPHVLVELIPRSGQGLFVLNVYIKPSLQHRFGELFRRARAVAGVGPLLIAGDFNAPHAAWGYGRETPKGKRLWEDSPDEGLEFIVNPADPTRRGNSACVDTLPDHSFVANVAAAQWQNTQEDLGSDHSLIEIRIDTGQHGRGSRSDGDGDRKARGRRLRIVEWDAFCKTRKERERGDGPITNIDEWTETLRRDVDAATREVPPEANLEVIDSRLLHMWEAKGALLERWRRQRHNRTLRRRLTKLDRDIEEHVFQVCGAQWEETCNSLETQLSGVSARRLFRHLLDPEETRTAQGHKIRRLRARVVMIHKPGKQVTIDNLRPISLTSCVGKVIEQAVLTRVTDYLEDSDVFSHTVLGFRRNLTTQDVMLQLKHQIVDDTSSSTKAILGLDLKKASDNAGVDAVQEYLRGTGLECSAAKSELLLYRPTSRGRQTLLPEGEAFKRAVGVPVNASTDRFLELGLHSTLIELIEAHDVAQYEGLSKSKTGRRILELLGITYHGGSDPGPRPPARPAAPQEHAPTHHVGRRNRRASDLQRRTSSALQRIRS